MRIWSVPLLACLSWAQLGELVWDWHGEGSQGQGYHQPGEAGQLYSRRFHTLRLTGDTLWVLGRVCVPAGDTAFLPNPTGAPIELKIFPPVGYRREASYIALYHRTTGAFLGALLAYAQLGAQYAVRFVDFVLSENRDTVWIAVDFPTDGCTSRAGAVTASPEVVWQSPSGATVPVGGGGGGYTMQTNQYTAQVWQIAGIGNPPNSWSLAREDFYWQGTGQLSLGIHGLAYRSGEVFVSGTIRLPSGGSASSLQPAALSSAYGPGGGDPSGNPACAFWVKLRTGSNFQAVAASIFHRDGGGTNVQAYGRALLLKGDTLLAFFNARRDGSGNGQMVYKVFDGNSFSSYNFTVAVGSCQPAMSGHVYVAALSTADLRPVNAGGFAASIYQLFCGDYSNIPTVGTLYPWLSGDTLWLMWNDDRNLSISNMSVMRGLFSYWTGVNTWSLSLGFGMPWVAQNVVWTGMTRAPDGTFFFSGRMLYTNPLLGQWSPTAATWTPLFSYQHIEPTGITSDAAGHLYFFGTGRLDNFQYERVRPRATALTVPLGNLSSIIHVSNKVGYGRGWIGRLLRYRAELLSGALPSSTCAPDTIRRPLVLKLYGRFDALSDSIGLRWNGPLPFTYGASTGHARWAMAALLPPPGGTDTARITVPETPILGRFRNGSYRLELGVVGWEESSDLMLPSFVSSLSINITGDKAPHLYPLESQRYWVYPFAGGPEASQGWRQASANGTFNARQAYLDGNASVEPHYAFTYVPFDPLTEKELLYVAINYTDSVILYSVDLATGTARRERGWPRLDDPTPFRDVSADTTVYGIQQLVWNPQRGHIIAVEGGHRLRTIYPGDYVSLDFVYPNRLWGQPSGASPAFYPMVAAPDPDGNATWTTREITMNMHVYRDVWTSFSNFTPTVFENYSSCMGPGGWGNNGIASLRGMVWGTLPAPPQLYFIDWGPPADPNNPSACAWSPYQLRLRRTSGGTIVDLDTFYTDWSPNPGMDSARFSMVYREKPVPHLLFPIRLPSGEGYIFRYWLDGRTKPRDTLIGGALVGDWSCEYSVDRWSPQTFPRAISLEVTRGGMILWSASEREIRAALPLYINRTNLPDTARWLAPTTISDASSGREVQLSWNVDTLRWAVDSLYSLRDTLSLRVRVSPCGGSWPLTHYAATLPSSPVATAVPSSLCQGEVFPIAGSLPNNDLFTLYLHSAENPTECGVQKLIEAIQMSSSASISPAGRVQPLQNGLYVAIDTCISPACQVQLGLPTGLQAESPWLLQLLEGYSTATGSFHIRRGHQVVVRVALEAPDRGDGTLSPHPAFSRLGLYRAARGNALGDSLTEWGVLGTLPGFWEALPSAWRRIGGAGLWDTNITPTAWRVPTWVTPVSVLLREAPGGPTVDSVWGFVDTLGRIWKWAPPMVDTMDCSSCPDKGYYQPWRLSFCRCDTSTPKWIVLRFPQHLPLRSAQAMDLSRDPAQPTLVDFRDPTYVEGIPGEHYALIPAGGGIMQAAAWAGNCADQAHAHWSGMPQAPDWGVINAADYEFILMRNGVTGPSTFTPADIDCDGDVDAVDILKVIENQNALRQSSVSD